MMSYILRMEYGSSTFNHTWQQISRFAGLNTASVFRATTIKN